MTDPAKFLQDLLIERKSKNAAYSTRALARDLGISPAFVSQVMSGKRNLSLEQKVKIRSLLGLRTSTRKTGREESDRLEMIEQTIEHEKILRYWYHFAILELCQLQKLLNRPAEIASRLRLSEIEIELAIERLLQFGYLSIEGGILVRTRTPFLFKTDKSSPALRELHQSRLAAASDELKAIDQERVERRCFQTMFLPTSARKVSEARAMIGKFQQKLIDFLKEDQPDEVFQLSLQLFSVEAQRPSPRARKGGT